VLLIGNPVNIIVSTANGISFTEYSNFMVAPAFAGCLVCGGLIYLAYRKEINVTFSPPEVSPDDSLKDKRGALFHGVILILTRIFLGIGPSIGAIMWITTAVPAVLCLFYNLAAWPLQPKEITSMVESPQIELAISEKSSAPIFIHLPKKTASQSVSSAGSPSKGEKIESLDEQETFTIDQPEIFITQTKEKEMKQKSVEPSPFDDTTMPTAKGSLAALPWAVIPFLFGMFTLVEALNQAGWIDQFATGIVSAIPSDEGNSKRAIAISTFLMTTISFVLCNLINNQPASILLTRVVLAPLFANLPSRVKSAGMFGVIEGANVGANWTIIGALAGILWSTILRNKGIVVGYFEFMKTGLLVMPLVTFIIAFVIFLEHI